MSIHYLDNSATTPVCEAARKAINDAIDNHFANPSSLHSLGADAEAEREKARKSVIEAMGFTFRRPENLIFTSGGTEAANLAIIGSVTSKARNKGKTVIVGEAEHDCAAVGHPEAGAQCNDYTRHCSGLCNHRHDGKAVLYDVRSDS